jgi:uncharacterized protein YhaN
MRIASLDLIAFGRFANQQLPFEQTTPDFHLVYGPNEAGKTTALEALRSLLYGIEERTPYAFRHANTELRVGAQLILDGQAHDIVRRKGRKNTLLDASGTPLEDGFLQQLLATMAREQFQRMFALTHEDLVLGGEEIVAGEGDAGQALFAAGLGGVHLNSLLRRTQEEADDLFRPRSSKTPLNQKLSQIRDLDAAIRGLQLSGEQWAKQGQESEKANARLHELVQQCETLAQEQLRLQRLARTLPLLGKVAELGAELSQMGEALPLAEDFDDRRRDALQRTEEANRNLAGLREKLQRARAQAAEVQVSDQWLQRAAETEQLAERLGSHQKGQKDSVKLRADYQAHLENLAELLAQLPGKPELAGALQAMPDAGVRASVEALAPQKQALDETLRIATEELQECRETLARAAADLDELPPETDTTSLQRTLKAIHKQGDLAGEAARHAKALAKEQTAAEQALAQLTLWQGDLQAVPTLQVPLEQTVIAFAARFRVSDSERGRLDGRKTELTGRELGLQQELQQLESSGAVPLETDLPASRRTRDDGWQLIKRHYVLGEQSDLSGYAADGDAATVYEGQVSEADRIADSLRRESQKVLQHARLESDLQQVRSDLEDITRQLDEHDGQREALLEEWRAQWLPAGIEPLSPEEMREWLRHLDGLRAAVGLVNERRQERETAQETLTAASSSLRAELVKLGEDDGTVEEPVAALIERAEGLLEKSQSTRDARSQLTRQLQEGRLHEQRRQQDVTKAELALQQWTGKWTEATRVLGMGEQPAVEQATAVLRVFRELDDENKEAAALERRLNGIERDTTAFQQDVERLVSELAPEFSDLTPVDATRQLQARLAAARQARTLLDRLNTEIEGHGAEIAESEEALRMARDDLQGLAEFAQCEVGGLQQVWERCQYRRDLEDKIRATEEQLINTGDGKSIRELQAEAAGLDGDAIKVRLQALTDEIATVTDERETQRKTAWELERILTSLDGSAEASAKADERQALLAEMRDEVEQYLTLAVARQLLVQGIEAYRVANQAPMLQRASTLFARMTASAFSGLTLEYGEADNPVLVGVRSGEGGTVKVEGMSDGTCDQLYLALRLAAIEQFSQEAEPLPLIVDDILIRFDDDRARETLAVLGEVSQHNQVIFLTHHRRLTQLADEVFGAGKYGRVELSS